LGDNVAAVGFIDANKNLKNESAKVILFEVTGASRSELQGATTIAGDKANFILANPNGITCNGCSCPNKERIEREKSHQPFVIFVWYGNIKMAIQGN